MTAAVRRRARRGAPGRRRRRAAALGLLALAGAWGGGCEERGRTNPFDPGNPETGGTPRLLNAVAGDGAVRLDWNLDPWSRVDELRVLRRLGPFESGVEVEIVRRVPGTSGTFEDVLIDNGLDAAYRLEIRTPRGEWLSSAVDTATTGASIPWLGDAVGFGLARLSPDGRDLLFRVGSPGDVLDLEPQEDGSVWAADFGNGAISWYGPEGAPRERWECYGANTLALDRREDLLWVGSFYQQRVYLYNRAGGAVWVDATAGLVEHLRAAPDGGAWCCLRGGRVRRLAERSVALELTGFLQPVAVAVDSAGNAWIADRAAAAVVRCSPDGLLRESSAARLSAPVEIELDREGGAWVADAGRGGIVHLDARLRERSFLAVPEAGALSWDRSRRLLWVCRPAAGRVDVYQMSWTGPDGWSGRRAASLDVGGRPNALAAVWSR